MAKFVATNVAVLVGGTNFSTNIAQVSLELATDEVETTAFGAGGHTRVGGLQDNSITLSFHQDFAAASVDATLFPLFNTLATVVVYPAGTTASATNPSYTCVALINSYSPIASSVGDLATFDVTWPISGTVTRATA